MIFQRIQAAQGRGIEVHFDTSSGVVTIWRRTIADRKAEPLDSATIPADAPDVRERLRQAFRWVIQAEATS